MKIDCHMHVNGRDRKWSWDDNDRIIEAADKLGIDQLCVSIPVVRGMPTMDEVRACNDDVLEATVAGSQTAGELSSPGGAGSADHLVTGRPGAPQPARQGASDPAGSDQGESELARADVGLDHQR